MTKQQSHRLIGALVAALAVLRGEVRAEDLGTAFTYQGSLEKGSPPAPVTDTCDFRFGQWNAAVGGAQVGNSPQSVVGVIIQNSVFSVPIDFGPGAFNGAARWLAIEVQCPGDADFVLLTPRIELTPVPYALRASQGVSGLDALTVTSGGDVGIGTTAPAASPREARAPRLFRTARRRPSPRSRARANDRPKSRTHPETQGPGNTTCSPPGTRADKG